MTSYLWLAREALRFTHGISVPCSDPQRLRVKLYKERAEANDPALLVLEFRISPLRPESELWIRPVRRKANGAD